MRMTSEQVDIITQSIRRHLGFDARIWLSGSRLDDGRRGGDLDLYVETGAYPLRNEFRCKIELEETLEMPVDLIVRDFEETTPIASIAKCEGLPL